MSQQAIVLAASSRDLTLPLCSAERTLRLTVAQDGGVAGGDGVQEVRDVGDAAGRVAVGEHEDGGGAPLARGADLGELWSMAATGQLRSRC